jgi:hypothetical protein
MVGPIKLKIDLPIICKKKLLTTEDTERESRSEQSKIEISYVNEIFFESIILCLIMQVGCCIYMNDSPFSIWFYKTQVGCYICISVDSSWLPLNQQKCISSHQLWY